MSSPTTDPPTDEQLIEWLETAEAASPGPWEQRMDGWTVRDFHGFFVATTYGASYVDRIAQEVANQQFIAEARATWCRR